MTTISAIYEGGVLRPTTPLDLNEGDVVDVTVFKHVAQPPPEKLTVEEWMRRGEAVKSIQEWADWANAGPDEDPEFDIMKAINESRRLTGFRMPSPESGGGNPQ